MNAVIDLASQREIQDQHFQVDLCWTRAKLATWGRVCHERGLGYPSMAAIERAIFGRGGRYTGPELPEDLEIIDGIIARAPIDYRIVLVESYTKSGPSKVHAARLMLPLRSYWRRRTNAERYVCIELARATV